MTVGQKEVAVCFQADQRSAGMAYRLIPSHFEPCPKTPVFKGPTSKEREGKGGGKGRGGG